MRLREAMDEVPDHRSSQGRRHPMGAILSLAVCAMLCGARSLYAIAQWGRDHGAATGEGLGFPLGKTPCVATFHRVFKDLDVAAFEAVLREWLIDSGIELGDVLSLDGKTLRGIHGGEIAGVHLVSAYAARSGVVLAQVAAPGEGSGISGGQGGAGSGVPGGKDSCGGRFVDATRGMPAGSGRWRGLSVAGEREPTHVAPGLGGRLFPHWKLKGTRGRQCPSGRRGSGGNGGPPLRCTWMNRRSSATDAGSGGTVGFGRPGVEPVCGQRWGGGRGVAPLTTDMPDRAAPDGERTNAGGGELRRDQPGCNRCWSGPPVADPPGALEDREPGALGKGRHL